MEDDDRRRLEGERHLIAELIEAKRPRLGGGVDELQLALMKEWHRLCGLLGYPEEVSA